MTFFKWNENDANISYLLVYDFVMIKKFCNLTISLKVSFLMSVKFEELMGS